MRFSLRSRHHAEVVPDERGTMRVNGELSWELHGPPADLDVAEASFGRFARRVHGEVLALDFGNAVGVFRVHGLFTLEVSSRKWGARHFDAMLSDIARVASSLPFSAGTSAPLPYDRSIAARDDVLYHAFVYIRHILSETAPRGDQLIPPLRLILADPHRRTTRQRVDVPVELVERFDHATLLAVASGAGPLVKLPSFVRGLPRSLEGHLPASLPESRLHTTVDTPENRFVKAFLEAMSAVIDRFREVCGRDRAFDRRVRSECDELAATLAPLRRHLLWREVGTMTHLPAASTVLQQRRGYRDVFRHFARFRLATKNLPLSEHQARDLLEARDIATLYELWAYFAVVDAVRAIAGPPSSVAELERSSLKTKVKRGFDVAWPNGLHVIYNLTFHPNTKHGHRTYSVEMRPDVTLILPGGDVHLFDAKFKLGRPPSSDDTIEFPPDPDDLYKMHAYRDAIEPARSAWALYPGTVVQAFLAAAHGLDGIGAIPLRPEAGGADDLVELLRRILQTAHAAA